jgi:hypothetical protein
MHDQAKQSVPAVMTIERHERLLMLSDFWVYNAEHSQTVPAPRFDC